jgi:hypothetical protein
MAQVGWVWVDNTGTKYRIGVYHGDQSGHVAIHCNLRIIQVDFAVKESRTYSFFIEEELCEVRLEKHKDGHFTYDFQINKTIDTPRNQIRRADERVLRRQTIAFVVGVVAVIALAFFGLNTYGRQQRLKLMSKAAWMNGVTRQNIKQLSQEGKNIEVALRSAGAVPNRRLDYHFVTPEGQSVSGSMPIDKDSLYILPNGFPYEEGDIFEIRYLPSNAQVHRLDFFQPARATIEAYIRRATRTEGQWHPEQTPEQVACIVSSVIDARNWTVLADFICQQMPPEVNMQHHRDTYLRLIRSPEINRAIQEKCLIHKQK